MALEAGDTYTPQAYAHRRAAMFRDTRAVMALDVRAALEESGYWNHPTLQNFRGAVGDQRANEIISNLGTAALRAAPSGLNVSLGTVISTALGKLTKDDIASLIRGESAVINRVQSDVQQQVRAQQAQRTAQGPDAAITDGGGAQGGRVLPLNGARFDPINSSRDGDSGDRASAARMTEARQLAVQLGLSWATSNPDLLRLGPAAIQVLADVHFRQDSYQRMTAAGFNARDVVNLARYAKRHNIDANDLARVSSESVQTFGGNDPNERRRWISLYNGVFSTHGNPQANEQARQRLSEALREQEQRHPEHRELVRQNREILRLQEQTQVRAEQTTARVVQTEARTAQRITDAEALFAAPSQPASSAPAPQASPPAAATPRQTATASAPAASQPAAQQRRQTTPSPANPKV